MLTFESPFYEEEGIVIFRDHADPGLFHYLAGPPRLIRDGDGRANFTLLEYRHALESLGSTGAPLRDQLGGGFLMFGVDCGLDSALKGRIESSLAARLPDGIDAVRLVPVLYSHGKVKVLALDAESGAAGAEGEPPESKFVRRVLGTATPSLLQDQRAIFSLALPPDGVVLLEDAYRNQLSPIGVMYELEFAGLRPALAVIAKVDLKRCYDKLELEFGVRSGGTGGGGAGGGAGGAGGATDKDKDKEKQGQAGGGTAVDLKLQLAMEKLREDGAIEITVTRQQEGQSVADMEKQAMDLLKESLLKQFFAPAMSTQPPSPEAAAQAVAQAGTNQINQGRTGGGGQTEIALAFKYTQREELKEATFDYRVQAPETRTHAPNGFFSALVEGTEAADHIRKIDLDDPFFRLLEVEVQTTADFAALDLQALEVELQYGGTPSAPAVAAHVVFTPTSHDKQTFVAALDRGPQFYRYRVRYRFGGSGEVEAAAQERLIGWRESTSRALVIHPPEDLALLSVLLEPGRVDWEIVDSIETRLAYRDPGSGFTAERTFLFSQTTAPQRWLVRLPEGGSAVYSAAHAWSLKGGSRMTGEPVETSVRRMFINDPFVDELGIIVDPQVDAQEVLRATVEVTYSDPDHGLDVHRSLELVGPDYHSATIRIPLVDPRRREYSYRVRLVKRGGQTEDRPPQTSDALSIVITPGGFLLEVQVALIGKMEQLGVSAVQVDLRAEPPEGSVQQVHSLLFLPGDTPRAPQRLLVRADRPAVFERLVKIFLTDGRTVESPWTAHASAILPISLAALLQGPP